jgi:hypothetical protein
MFPVSKSTGGVYSFLEFKNYILEVKLSNEFKKINDNFIENQNSIELP